MPLNSPRLRKLVGSLVLLVFVAAYAFAAAGLGALWLDGASAALVTGYYIAAGFLWIVPAAWFIRWMQARG